MTFPVLIPFVNFKRRYELYRDEILHEVNHVFSSSSYILGNFVDEFEEKMSAYLGCHVLGVANGTDAIILALKLLGIGANDEVIVPVNSFVASAGAVVAVNAKPIFCDVNKDLNLDDTQLEKHITQHTKAIMPVHLTGHPADMDKIISIAKIHKLAVVEDAAQSIGATYKGKMTGSWGDFGCFSLHPLKNLHVYGDGGLISTNDRTYYEELKLLRNHGLMDRNTCVRFGLNSRLDAVQAKIACLSMKYLSKWNERRRQIADRYRDLLTDFVKMPQNNIHKFSVYHNFVILSDQRDKLMTFLQNKGIETKIHYPIPLHLQPASAQFGYQKGDFPMAENLAMQMLSLPIYPELTDSEIEIIAHAIREFYE